MPKPPLIYAHRGFWLSKEEQNSKAAIDRAKNLGFGVELDFRSRGGELVISHDPVLSDNFVLASEVEFENIPIACNIKEDGLADLLSEFVIDSRNSNSFLFDGSVPEMLKIREKGIPHAMRVSELEQVLLWKSEFVWVDSFYSDWWLDSDFVMSIEEKSFLIFVSPELHGRNYFQSWRYLKMLHEVHGLCFGICTDYPLECRNLFDE